MIAMNRQKEENLQQESIGVIHMHRFKHRRLQLQNVLSDMAVI